ncbi:VOC family protein [Thauera linaloolentis]|uniref:VOC family protein n=1 Tax=Thauera linaloolentis TaxID=76112 RepID=UPI00048DCDA6|nr:VOC family protein [Thauera linaloolentis]MCM8564923.1 VOC family protein [Thauera linaloolentis]
MLNTSPTMLRTIESIIRFVPDIEAAAAWYADLLGGTVRHENPQFAFVHADGLTIGFHPADSKCPGGIGGTTVYWEVQDIEVAIRHLEHKGAVLYRSPITTGFGARAAILVDPFGCTIGLNQGNARSRALIRGD